MGVITEDDVKMIKALVLTPELMESMDMLGDEWSDARLVTPRHSVRQHWNDASLRQWCATNGHQILVCTAEDTLSAKTSSKSAQIVQKDTHDHSDKRRRTPPRTIDMAIGMKVMVTDNVETDLDITNGARGRITGIVLDPNEPPLGDGPEAHLKHLPLYILVKLDRTKASQLPPPTRRHTC